MSEPTAGALHLLQCHPDVQRLALWGHRMGLLRTRQETGFDKDDPGYVFHALFKAVFEALAPKPFWYRGGRDGLLAFTRQDPQQLRDAASLTLPDASPLLAAMGLDLSAPDLGLASRKYPDRWATGHRLGFETRVRPVVRLKGRERGPERDAFLAHLERLAEADRHESSMMREAVYSEWLGKQFARDGAALIESAQVVRYRLTSVLRQQGVGDDGRRSRALVSGPEVVMAGTLRVGDPDAFAALLARGVGRHRAFGFGLMLLRPVT